MTQLPRVITDDVLSENLIELLDGKIERLPWSTLDGADDDTVDGILTFGHLLVTAEHLAKFPDLKVVSNYGVGVDHIDVDAAHILNIPVGNTPHVLNGTTADQAMTLLLAAGRRLREGDIYARSPEFTYFDPAYMLGTEIHHQTVGIIGLGGIGYQIARRCAAFDMNILYHKRTPLADNPDNLDLTYVTLNELLEQSDFVVTICPLTEETTGLIGKEELARMKNSAVLINVARGPVVDTDALTEALQNGEIYAAGLDVTDPEPLPRDHPLLSVDNVTITPHLGSATIQTRRKMAEISVENLLLGLGGQALLHSV
ncbi:MAG: D-glycerate dehydrogenase [Planctomycetaceae bacterium]|nr:D-glycerate dehydrogenase [Planctomycetaceae bacterium]